MKTIKSFGDYFIDSTYIKYKERYVKNPLDVNLADDWKAAFKCNFVSDYATLLDKASLTPKITYIPKFIESILDSSSVPGLFDSFDCFFDFFNPIVWEQYNSVKRKFPEKLRKNRNHRFGQYFRKSHQYAKRELLEVRCEYNSQTIYKYRMVLLIFKIITRTFYLSALPRHISKFVYDKCVSLDSNFANYYQYDEKRRWYFRKKFQKGIVTSFSETIAWWMVYSTIENYGLIR